MCVFIPYSLFTAFPNITDYSGPIIKGAPNATIFLYCTADAIPSLTLHWYKDGVLIAPNSNNSTYIFSINGSVYTLAINNLISSNEGQYQCVAANPLIPASIERNITVIINANNRSDDNSETLIYMPSLYYKFI